MPYNKSSLEHDNIGALCNDHVNLDLISCGRLDFLLSPYQLKRIQLAYFLVPREMMHWAYIITSLSCWIASFVEPPRMAQCWTFCFNRVSVEDKKTATALDFTGIHVAWKHSPKLPRSDIPLVSLRHGYLVDYLRRVRRNCLWLLTPGTGDWVGSRWKIGLMETERNTFTWVYVQG